MALRDYILCGTCECKLLYDGDDNGRDRLESVFGEGARLLCPDCIATLRQQLAEAQARLVAHEAMMAGAVEVEVCWFNGEVGALDRLYLNHEESDALKLLDGETVIVMRKAK